MTLRSSKYPRKLFQEHHEALVEHIKSLKGRALLNGHNHLAYGKLDLKLKDFDVPCSTVENTRCARPQGEGVLKE